MSKQEMGASEKQMLRFQEIFIETKDRLIELKAEMEALDKDSSEYKKLFWETDRLNAFLSFANNAIQSAYQRDFQEAAKVISPEEDNTAA